MYSKVGNRHRWLIDQTPMEEHWYDYARLDRPLWSATGPTIPVVLILGFLGIVDLGSGEGSGFGWLAISLVALLFLFPIGYRLFARSRNQKFMLSGRVIALDLGYLGSGLRSLIFRNAPELSDRQQFAVIEESCSGPYRIIEAFHPINAFLKDHQNWDLLYDLDSDNEAISRKARAKLLSRAQRMFEFMDGFVESAQEVNRDLESLMKRADAACAKIASNSRGDE